MTERTHDPRSVIDTDTTGPRWKQAYAAYYREYAAEIRDFAEREPHAAIRDRLWGVADDYDKLADHLDPEPRGCPVISPMRMALLD